MLTPIKCIITHATFLLQALANTEYAGKILCLLRTGQILQSYTRDLLDRAHLDNGALLLRKKCAKLSRVVHETVEIMKF